MDKDKFCSNCGKKLEDFWVGAESNGNDLIFCAECASKVLVEKCWQLENENKKLKDRWQKFKNSVECSASFNNICDDLFEEMKKLERE